MTPALRSLWQGPGNDNSRGFGKIMTLEKTQFTEMLIGANGFDPKDFKNWVFCQGMRFNSPDKWWGDKGKRDFPHEGIDFCLYADRAGQVRRIGAKTCLPVMHHGVVRALFADFLGMAIILEHESAQGAEKTFLSAYAHTEPLEGIRPGVRVKKGDIIATIADTRRSKAKILPHLHFSIGQPAPDLVYERFVWNDMRNPGLVTLLDPQSIIDFPCQALDLQDPYCL